MSKATLNPAPAQPFPQVVLDERVNYSAFWTLFRLTLRQCSRGRRLIVLSVLFALPVLIAILLRTAGQQQTFRRYIMMPEEAAQVPERYLQRDQQQFPGGPGRGHVDPQGRVIQDRFIPPYIEYRPE